MKTIFVSLYTDSYGVRIYQQRRVALRVENGISMRDAAKQFRKDEARIMGGEISKRPSLLKIEIEMELPSDESISAAAAAMGRKGGLVTGGVKADASRINGRAPVKPGSNPRGRKPKAQQTKEEQTK